MSGRAPADELELKARVPDVPVLRRALVRAGATLEFRGRMIDRRFDRDGKLASRDEVLRLRIYYPYGRMGRTAVRPYGHTALRPYGVLSWKGPASRRGKYRHRLELEAHVAEPVAVREILRLLRFKVSLKIDRRVEIWRLGRAILRIERYPRMDTLVEVEGRPGAIERAVRATGLARERFLPKSLPHFVRLYEARTGRRARLAPDDE